jgi:hypothetical protein
VCLVSLRGVSQVALKVYLTFKKVYNRNMLMEDASYSNFSLFIVKMTKVDMQLYNLIDALDFKQHVGSNSNFSLSLPLSLLHSVALSLSLSSPSPSPSLSLSFPLSPFPSLSLSLSNSLSPPKNHI